MQEKILQQYMAHLNVHTIEVNHRMVHEGWHEFEKKIQWNKLYFFESGEGLIVIDGFKYAPKPGQCLFIPEGSIQSLYITSPKRYVKYWCHFHANIGTTPLGRLLDFPLLINVQEKEHFTQLFDLLVKYYNSDDHFAPLRTNGLLMELLHHHLTVNAKNLVALSKESGSVKMNTLLTYMQDNLNKKMQIHDFATLMNLHPNYLIRLFKNTFGSSPMDYFNQLKIEKAKEMLEVTQDPINIIADKLAFSSPYYFSKVFKSHTSFTPKDYRQSHHNRQKGFND